MTRTLPSASPAPPVPDAAPETAAPIRPDLVARLEAWSLHPSYRLPTVMGILAALAGVGLAAASGFLISRAALKPDVFMSLLPLATAVRALGVGRAGFRYAERLTGHAAALRQGEGVRLTVFDSAARLGRDLLAFERGGDLLARSGADVDARQFYALRVTLPLWALAGVLVVLGVWLALTDPLLTVLALLPLGVAAWTVWATRQELAELTRQESVLARDHSARLLDALAASGDGAARHHAPHLDALSAELEAVTARLGALTWRCALVREVGFAAALAGVLWRGADLVVAGSLPGLALAAVVLATAAAFDVLGPLAAAPAAHAADEAARERQDELSALTPAAPAPAQPLSLPAGPFALALDGVTVVRGGRPVLHGVSLTLASGDTLALTGESGGGKTTLLRVLLRDLPADAGSVLAGGLHLHDLSPEDWRSRLSLHEQDAPLLDGTLRENLLLGDHHAPDERLRGLLDALGLTHLPLDGWVGEGGTRLSGGERARVSLARALLKPSELLLLDEPTAHLDPDLEAQVLDVIARERRGRSLLIVTHRPAPLGRVGRVLRLQGGRLSEGAPLPVAAPSAPVPSAPSEPL